MNKTKHRGLTFIEVMIAALLLVVILLPVFNFLTNAVKNTEKIYIECVAINQAKLIMDTMLFQIPWKDIRVDDHPSRRNTCYFEIPNYNDANPQHVNEKQFLDECIPQLFGTGCKQNERLWGDGIIKTDKGFLLRARAKVVDLDQETYGDSQDITLNVDGNSPFHFKDITSKDSDDKYNLVKKIIVQVKWSLLKDKDPNEDKRAMSMFLVGFKSNLEGQMK